MNYDNERYFEGSYWFDMHTGKVVQLYYCRATTDFKEVDTGRIYGVRYTELENRMRTLD